MATVNTQGFAGQIDSVVSGDDAVHKTCSGVLSLYAENEYTGGTLADEGTVAIMSPHGLGHGDLTLGNNANSMGTLRLDADMDIVGRTITLNAGGGRIDTQQHAASTNSFSIVGNDDLHKTGPGTLMLEDTQPYTGRTFIDQGILSLDAYYEPRHVPGGSYRHLPGLHQPRRPAPGARHGGRGRVHSRQQRHHCPGVGQISLDFQQHRAAVHRADPGG